MKSAWVSSRNGFFEECLTLKIAIFNLRSLKELCVLMAEKAFERFAGDVSVGNVSMVGLGTEERRDRAREDRLSGFRARSATARFPCDGWASIRAMPAPFKEKERLDRALVRCGGAYRCWAGADKNCETRWSHCNSVKCGLALGILKSSVTQ